MVNFLSFGDVRDKGEDEERHISSIQEHSPLSDRQVYELRTLKAPATHNCKRTDCLPKP